MSFLGYPYDFFSLHSYKSPYSKACTALLGVKLLEKLLISLVAFIRHHCHLIIPHKDNTFHLASENR